MMRVQERNQGGRGHECTGHKQRRIREGGEDGGGGGVSGLEVNGGLVNHRTNREWKQAAEQRGERADPSPPLPTWCSGRPRNYHNA